VATSLRRHPTARSRASARSAALIAHLEQVFISDGCCPLSSSFHFGKYFSSVLIAHVQPLESLPAKINCTVLKTSKLCFWLKYSMNTVAIVAAVLQRSRLDAVDAKHQVRPPLVVALAYFLAMAKSFCAESSQLISQTVSVFSLPPPASPRSAAGCTLLVVVVEAGGIARPVRDRSSAWLICAAL
jgi:hypothetical protein